MRGMGPPQRAGRKGNCMRQLAAPGTILGGRFAVTREIGRGPRSVVCLAVDQRHGREVALKLYDGLTGRLQRLVVEAADLARYRLLVPREIVDGTPALLVLDHLPGTDLGHEIAAQGGLPPAAVAEFGRQAARSLAAAHRRGLLHGNLTPRNILLPAAGGVWLTDLAMEPTSQAFLAPEVRRGAAADPRADLYALGLVLYVGLTGRLPAVPAPTLPDGLRPSERREDVPAWLDDAIARATALLPADRFSRASQLAEALEPPRPSRAMAG